MLIELHLIQNFAPSNLNRDDTGAPKDCEFGGYRRARISSQCLKRAIREAFEKQGLLSPDDLAIRTRRLSGELARRLIQHGKPEDQAQAAAEAVLRGVGFGIKEEGRTEYLLFVGEREIGRLLGVCLDHWDDLARSTVPSEEPTSAGGRAGRKAKQAGQSAVSGEVASAVRGILDSGDRTSAPDIALFGRMLADLPRHNIDAASQVAHAISTHRVSMEFDFYTAVDELNPDDTAGAGMMGTVEFNSATFYRYANVDISGLARNLGDGDLTRRTLEAFLRASVRAVPTGKQNSMAAQNPPSFVFAVARRSGLWSLANAFVQPVRADRDGDLVSNSIAALDRYWGNLVRMYGDGEIGGAWTCSLDDGPLPHLGGALVPNVDAVIAGAVGTATGGA